MPRGPESRRSQPPAPRCRGWLVLVLASAGLVLGWHSLLPVDRRAAERLATRPGAGPADGEPSVTARAVPKAGLARGTSEVSLVHEGDPESFLRDMIPVSDPDDPEARCTAVREFVATTSPEEAYPLLSQLAVAPPAEATREFVPLLLDHLAEADVHTLERWARNLPDNTMRAEAFVALALQRSAADGSAAAEWARHLGPSTAEAAAAIQVATELARTRPAEALDLAAGLPASLQRDQCLAHGVAQWAAHEPTEAAAWAVAVEDDLLRDQLLARVIPAMAEEDPRAAADWAALALPEGPAQTSAAVAVAQRWAQHDLVSARAWVEAFPDGRLRQTALDAVEQAISSQPQSDTPAAD